MRALAGSYWCRIASQIGGGNRHSSARRAPSCAWSKPKTSRSTSAKPTPRVRACASDVQVLAARLAGQDDRAERVHRAAEEGLLRVRGVLPAREDARREPDADAVLEQLAPELREAVAIDREQAQHCGGDRERADRAEAEHDGGVGDRLDAAAERVVRRVGLPQDDGREAGLAPDARRDVLHAGARIVACGDHGLDGAVGRKWQRADASDHLVEAFLPEDHADPSALGGHGNRVGAHAGCAVSPGGAGYPRLPVRSRPCASTSLSRPMPSSKHPQSRSPSTSSGRRRRSPTRSHRATARSSAVPASRMRGAPPARSATPRCSRARSIGCRRRASRSATRPVSSRRGSRSATCSCSRRRTGRAPSAGPRRPRSSRSSARSRT